ARSQWLHVAAAVRQNREAMNPRASGRAAARVPDAIRSVPALPSLCSTLEPSYHIATSLSQNGSSVSRNIQSRNSVELRIPPYAQTAAIYRKSRVLPSEGRGREFESRRARQ